MSPPVAQQVGADIFHWESFLTYPEKKKNRQEKEKEKLREETTGNCKREGKKLKMEVEECEQTTFAFQFMKPLKFVWGVPNWKTSTGKNYISQREKNREK